MESNETALSRMTLGLVRMLGASPEKKRSLARLAGLPTTRLDERLDDDTSRRLWEVATRASGDPDFGLHFAEHAALADLGIVGYLGRASATFGDGCARVVRFQLLFKDLAQLRLNVDERRAILVDIPPQGRPAWPRHLAEAVIASWVVWPSRWANTPCRPSLVRFQHGRPDRTAEHARVFGCPIHFGAAENALEFTRETWATPFATADPLLAQYLELAATDSIRRRPRADVFIERVEAAIVGLLPSGQVGASRVARSVGVSSRTLHRRLAERGLKYQGLLDDARRRTALALLERQEHNVTEVAFLVGFSDPSGLRRAFRRWTGRPPRMRDPCA